MTTRREMLNAAGALLLAGSGAMAPGLSRAAAQYPSSPISLIVPVGAGRSIPCRVVAVSDLSGAVHNPGGLDPANLTRYVEETGSVAGFPVGERIERDELFEVECEILAPCALSGAITLKDGVVEQSNFHDYPPIRIADMPQVEVHIVPSTQPPSGVGEPGVPPIAPAIANAVFALNGKRLRSLPFKLA